MRHKAVAVLAALAATAAVSVLALPAAAAGNAGSTVVSSFDPTGAVFTCPGTDYTALGGTVRTVIHDSLAANGTEHVTGTTSPIGVTLTDGSTSTVYRLSGASWFGGNLDPVTGVGEFGDTEFFNIIAPGGGVVAKVAGVEHVFRNGSDFSFTFGACQPRRTSGRAAWTGANAPVHAALVQVDHTLLSSATPRRAARASPQGAPAAPSRPPARA